MRTRALLALAALAVAAPASEAGAAATAPTEIGSPWPSMRHDPQQHRPQPDPRAVTGPASGPGPSRTGKGVFSTPVVGADGTVYAGSADTWFYALGSRGRLRWRFKTGEIIDSAAVLGRGRHRDLRLGRRARLPAAHRPRPAAAAGLALPGDAQAGPGAAGELVGGQRGHGTRRGPLRREHGRSRVRPQPRRHPALGLSRPATRCGRTRRSGTTARSSSARSTSASTRSTAAGG